MSIEQALAESATDGIDCFFENVGGPSSTEIIKKMNKNGRIAVCGAISIYNDQKPTMVPSFIQYMIYNVSLLPLGRIPSMLYKNTQTAFFPVSNYQCKLFSCSNLRWRDL